MSFLYIVTVFVYLIYQFPYEGYMCCGTDILVFIMNPLNYMMITIVPVIMSSFYISKHDFVYSFSIRHKSWKDIWICQIKRELITSFLYSTCIILCVFVFCYLNGIPLYNWNQNSSFFYLKNGIMLNDTSLEIYPLIFVCLFIRSLFFQSVILLTEWIHISKVVGVVIMVIICLDETVRGQDRIVNRLFTADYSVWMNQGMRTQMIVQGIAYFILGYVLFRVIIDRKELGCGVKNKKASIS